MRIVLTGGSGYIGSSLTPVLIKKYGRVYNIGRNTISEVSINGSKEYCEFTYESLFDSLVELSPDLVINLAAGYYNDSGAPDLNVIDGNLKIPFIILEYFKSCNYGRFINIGSYWEFSFSGRVVKGVNPYGIIKSTVRRLLDYYSKYNVIYTNLILYGSYGDNDHRGKIVDCIIDAVNSNETLKLSPGEQKLNLVYIDDIIEAILYIVSSDNGQYDNETLSIYTPTEHTVKEIVCFINEIKDNNLSLGGGRYRNDEVMAPDYKYRNIFHAKDKLKEYITSKIKK